MVGYLIQLDKEFDKQLKKRLGENTVDWLRLTVTQAVNVQRILEAKPPITVSDIRGASTLPSILTGFCTNFARTPDPIIDVILPRLTGKNVWDLGCGDGYFLSRASTVANSITGIELDENLAAEAVLRLGNIENSTILRGDFLSIGKASEFTTLLGNSIEFTPQPNSVIYLNLGKPCMDKIFRLNQETDWYSQCTIWSLNAYLIDWVTSIVLPPDEEIVVNCPKYSGGEIITQRLFRYGP